MSQREDHHPDMIYILVCRACTALEAGAEPVAIPFDTAEARGRWAAAHRRATGHDSWWVKDAIMTNPGDVEPGLAERLRQEIGTRFEAFPRTYVDTTRGQVMTQEIYGLAFGVLAETVHDDDYQGSDPSRVALADLLACDPRQAIDMARTATRAVIDDLPDDQTSKTTGSLHVRPEDVSPVASHDPLTAADWHFLHHLAHDRQRDAEAAGIPDDHESSAYRIGLIRKLRAHYAAATAAEAGRARAARDVPPELLAVLDRAAGRTHSRDGAVARTLAEILARYDQLRKRPPRARAPGTGDWKPEVIRVVDALRTLDLTGFDPSSLDDLADVAAIVVGELCPPTPIELPESTE